MHTLLLVASIRQLPEIEALASPSHLMSLGDSRTIYPTIQPVHLPPDSLQAGKHPLHLLLKQATQLAEAHRGGGMGAALGVGGSPPAGRPLSWMSRGRERRGSGSSASDSNWMTMNPADRATKWFTFGRRSNGSSPTGSQLDLPLPGLRAAGAQSNPRPMSVMSTATTASRASGMGMGGRDKKRQDTPSEGSPFDAVINLIPSAPSTDQRQALTKMLQHTTVLTTAVLPILTAPPSAKSVTATAPVMDLPPLSVIHVVPADAPPALAPVIERFLAPLLPLMGARTRRPFFGCVTGYRQWRSSTISTAEDSLPGAETLLFGGVSSATGDETLRQQALLGSWEQCAIAPGALDVAHRAKPAEFSSRASAQALGEARANTSTGRAPLPHTRSMPLLREEERTRSRPAVSPLASGRSSTNSNSNSRNAASPLSPISYTPTAPRSPSGLRYAVQPSPPTPELDASSSSCSSASLEPPPETESQPAQQPRIAQAATAPMPMPTPSPPVDKVKEKRGFGAMFRRARGIKA
jgi:hypothetical protein